MTLDRRGYARQWMRYYAVQLQAATYRIQVLTRRLDQGMASAVDQTDLACMLRRVQRCTFKLKQWTERAA